MSLTAFGEIDWPAGNVSPVPPCRCGGIFVAGAFVHAEACGGPDPFPLTAILRAAVDHAKARHGYPSDAVAAEAFGLSPQALSRALRDTGRATSPETLRRVLRVAGMRVVLLPAD